MNSFIIKILATAIISISAISFIIYQKSEIKNLELNLDIEKQNVERLTTNIEKLNKINKLNENNIKEQVEKIIEIQKINVDSINKLTEKQLRREKKDIDLIFEKKKNLMEIKTNQYIAQSVDNFNKERKEFKEKK